MPLGEDPTTRRLPGGTSGWPPSRRAASHPWRPRVRPHRRRRPPCPAAQRVPELPSGPPDPLDHGETPSRRQGAGDRPRLRRRPGGRAVRRRYDAPVVAPPATAAAGGSRGVRLRRRAHPGPAGAALLGVLVLLPCRTLPTPPTAAWWPCPGRRGPSTSSSPVSRGGRSPPWSCARTPPRSPCVGRMTTQPERSVSPSRSPVSRRTRSGVAPAPSAHWTATESGAALAVRFPVVGALARHRAALTTRAAVDLLRAALGDMGARPLMAVVSDPPAAAEAALPLLQDSLLWDLPGWALRHDEDGTLAEWDGTASIAISVGRDEHLGAGLRFTAVGGDVGPAGDATGDPTAHPFSFGRWTGTTTGLTSLHLPQRGPARGRRRRLPGRRRAAVRSRRQPPEAGRGPRRPGLTAGELTREPSGSPAVAASGTSGPGARPARRHTVREWTCRGLLQPRPRRGSRGTRGGRRGAVRRRWPCASSSAWPPWSRTPGRRRASTPSCMPTCRPGRRSCDGCRR